MIRGRPYDAEHFGYARRGDPRGRPRGKSENMQQIPGKFAIIYGFAGDLRMYS